MNKKDKGGGGVAAKLKKVAELVEKLYSHYMFFLYVIFSPDKLHVRLEDYIWNL